MTIAAHLIVGRAPEPYLAPLLESLAGVADEVLVNDNSGEPDGPNARALAASAFARAGALIVDRAPFVDFAAARNRVLALHREHSRADWVCFVDANEVHWPAARRIAARLGALDPAVGAVDAYMRSYLQSFRWVTSLDRRLAFFRFTPELRWENPVHERLLGIPGTRLVIPYVYEHYGWIMPARVQTAKFRLYIALGAPGTTVSEQDEATMDDIEIFVRELKLAMRYDGPHPPVMAAAIAAFESDQRERLAAIDAAVARHQTPYLRVKNAVRWANFQYRWRGRAIDPRARALVRA